MTGIIRTEPEALSLWGCKSNRSHVVVAFRFLPPSISLLAAVIAFLTGPLADILTLKADQIPSNLTRWLYPEPPPNLVG